MSDPITAVSTTGGEIDLLIWAMLAASGAVMLLVFGLMLYFIIRYRADSPIDRGHPAEEKSWRLEIGWTSATLLVFFGLFVWGAKLYARIYIAPPDSYKIRVIGKQWMWKLEYPEGQREINSLHVPVGRAIQLIMTSEDVIHDFAVPALRIKQDVVPGRYQSAWFEATTPGVYHLFCTQFCGTEHASMGGRVTVMSEADFAAWLSNQDSAGSLVTEGKQLYISRGCDGCHEGRGTVKAPSLKGIGDRMDETRLRAAILHPFTSRPSEDELAELVAYLEEGR